MTKEILLEDITPIELPKPDMDLYRQRKEQMVKLRNDKKMTLAAIAKWYGITRQRVFQILKDEKPK